MTAKSETVGVVAKAALPETITLLGQWRCDGTVEAFRVNDMMTIPEAEGVIYVRPKDAIAFFGLVSKSEISELLAQVDEAASLAEEAIRQRDTLISGLEALAGEWDEMSTEPGLSKDEIDKILTISMDHTLRDCANQLRTLASTATDGELK